LLTKEQALAALNNDNSDVRQFFASTNVPGDQYEAAVTNIYATKDYQVIMSATGTYCLFPDEPAE